MSTTTKINKTLTPQQQQSNPTTGTNDPTVNGWVTAINNKTAKITDVPAAYKNSVIQALATSTGTNVSQLATDALAQAKKLQDDFSKGKFAVGGSSMIPTLPGTNARDYQRNFAQLQALLSLDNIKYLKGTGAISDAEERLLANAASSISLDMSESEYKDTLQQVVDTLTKATAALSTSPDAGSDTTGPAAGTDGASYGFPGYHSDGKQWVPN